MYKTRTAAATVVLALVLALAVGGPQARPTGPQEPFVGRAQARTVCQEDQWCWNWLLQGNHTGRYLWQ